MIYVLQIYAEKMEMDMELTQNRIEQSKIYTWVYVLRKINCFFLRSFSLFCSDCRALSVDIPRFLFEVFPAQFADAH